MTPELRESFRSTRYALLLPTGEVNLAVDQHCPPLGELLHAAGCASAAWLTAFNPGGQLRANALNLAAQRELESRLLRKGFSLIPGTAIDPAGQWPPEPSALAMGISLGDAMTVAREFLQLAFLWCDTDAVPRLMETDQGSR